MYNLPVIEKRSPYDYANYVDQLRYKYSVRIEAKCPSRDPNEHKIYSNELIQYLFSNLDEGTWYKQITNTSSYSAYNYIWFMHNEDAVAFMLKYDGIRI